MNIRRSNTQPANRWVFNPQLTGYEILEKIEPEKKFNTKNIDHMFKKKKKGFKKESEKKKIVKKKVNVAQFS